MKVMQMGFLDTIKGIVTKETCIRAINYDKRNLELKFDAEAAGVKFSMGDFKTEIDKIREASEFSELLDNYQYPMCIASHKAPKPINVGRYAVGQKCCQI